MTKLAIEFGRAVRARRKARGLTQAKLSEASQLSEEWVRRIERGVGAPSFDAIEALARALCTSVADLFAPLTERSDREVKIASLLSTINDAELIWVEEIVRVALRRPG